MNVVWEQEWDKIYKDQGEVQFGILPTVVVAAELFEKNRCETIMDLGCGTGRHSIYLASKGFHVIATDVSETAVEHTRAKAVELGLANMEFKQHDMRNIPYEDNSLDAVLCVWTTGHGNLEDTRQTTNEIYRVLKSGGMVVIDYVSTEDTNYGKGEELEKDTFINNVEGEENIPHHYSSKEELEDLYIEFTSKEMSEIEYKFEDSYGNEHIIKAFVLVGVK